MGEEKKVETKIHRLLRNMIWEGAIYEKGSTLDIPVDKIADLVDRKFIEGKPLAKHVEAPPRTLIAPSDRAVEPPTMRAGIVEHVRDITDEVDVEPVSRDAHGSFVIPDVVPSQPPQAQTVADEFLSGASMSSENKQVRRPGRPAKVASR
jgi:hypothetical protein